MVAFDLGSHRSIRSAIGGDAVMMATEAVEVTGRNRAAILRALQSPASAARGDRVR
jgi:hypothetical protein